MGLGTCRTNASAQCRPRVHGRLLPDDASHLPRYVGCFNARYRRTGTLWEGRFKSALVDGDRYVLACYRYIELNLARAGMAATALDYRCTSHAHNAKGMDEPRINPQPACIALDTTEAERQKAYQHLFDEGTVRPLLSPGVRCELMDRVLVTAALGNVGREVVHACAQRGFIVRASGLNDTALKERFPATEVARLDFLDPDIWSAALDGCTCVFLLRPPPLADMDATLCPFVDASYAAGVKHIVFLSVAGADRIWGT